MAVFSNFYSIGTKKRLKKATKKFKLQRTVIPQLTDIYVNQTTNCSNSNANWKPITEASRKFLKRNLQNSTLQPNLKFSKKIGIPKKSRKQCTLHSSLTKLCQACQPNLRLPPLKQNLIRVWEQVHRSHHLQTPELLLCNIQVKFV